MKKCFEFSGILLIGALVSNIGYSEVKKSEIPSIQARQSTLVAMDKLLVSRPYLYSLSNDIINPFAPPVVQHKNKEVVAVRTVSDRELITTLAAQLNPTGVLMLGDQALLTFREKKVKVGEMIKIPFDNHTYEVEVVDVSRTAFTIKFNNEEITRPIKPGKQ